MVIYTKKGDKGETGLPGKRRLPKTEALIELLGNLDQSNAVIGICLSLLQDSETELHQWFIRIQRYFLEIGSWLAAEQPEQALILTRLPKVVEELETQIDHWDKLL